METRMTKRISRKVVRLAAATVVAVGCLAISAGVADAAKEVAYDNINTVAQTVNGHPNEATYSAYSGYFSSGGGFGGLVEFADVQHQQLSTLTTQLDVFQCEHGVYSLENCYTGKPSKKFADTWTVSIYRPGPSNEELTLLTTGTATFKLHYRPTTTVSCPNTVEGKGFGPNCDVGGYLQTVTFKHFSPAISLPDRAIILLTSSASPIVNVGLQASYKEYNTSTDEFVAEPAIGLPAFGGNPYPEDAYVNGTFESGWAGLQPVFKVTTK
jgi:hypothetical protein